MVILSTELIARCSLKGFIENWNMKNGRINGKIIAEFDC